MAQVLQLGRRAGVYAHRRKDSGGQRLTKEDSEQVRPLLPLMDTR